MEVAEDVDVDLDAVAWKMENADTEVRALLRLLLHHVD